MWELLKDHYFMSCLVGGELNVPKWGPCGGTWYHHPHIKDQKPWL